MRLGTSIDTDLPIDDVVEAARTAKDQGFATLWSSQIMGVDTLTVFAALAREVDGVALATGVVPVQPRHPQVLAQQALTVQAISGGRLTLGIGLSHKIVVEGMWGLSYDRPATFMREYLDALLPMLAGETVDVTGELVSAHTFAPVGPKGAAAPAVVVAALGPAMLKLAGSRTDGTVTWMTGTTTLRDYIVPTIREAAAAAGRREPRVIASFPICVTDDPKGAAERIDKALAIYPTLPSYKAMLDKEGAASASDVAFIGTKDQVVDAIGAAFEAGVTELGANALGSREERETTLELLGELARS